MTYDALPAVEPPSAVDSPTPPGDLDERERTSLQQLSRAAIGADVEVPYIRGLLDTHCDELELELLAVSLHLGQAKLFIRAHALESWSGHAAESSTQLMFTNTGTLPKRDAYHKLPLLTPLGVQLGSLHVIPRAGELSDEARARLDDLVQDIIALLRP